MRHHHDRRQLSRTAEHRRALLRSLVTALFEYERIETTVAKAKETRRVAERMITYAKRNSLHSRRLVARVVQDREVAKKLFETITPWYATRQGGYTRILKTRRRLGDAGEMAILELVKSEEQKEADRKVRAARAEAKAEKKKTKEEAAAVKASAEEKAEKEEAKAKKEKPETEEKKPAPKPTAKVEEEKPPAKKPAEKKAAQKKPIEKKPTEKKPTDKKPKKGGLLGRIRKKKSED